MPPIAVHFALAAGAAWLGARRLPRAEDRAFAAWGLVAGAVMVDADLIVGTLAALPSCLAGGCDPDVGKLIHRTLTHSVFLVAALALGGLALVWSAGTRVGGSGSAARRGWGVFALAFALSTAVLHILPDAFYLVGVKLLFPLTLDEFFFGPFAKERFSDPVNNVINGLDFLSESLAWLWVWGAARAWGTANRFTRLLPWFAAANAVFYVTVTALLAARQDYDTFLVTLYAPGLLNIVVSTVLVPLLARRTLMRLGGEPPRDARARRGAAGTAGPR